MHAGLFQLICVNMVQVSYDTDLLEYFHNFYKH